MASAQDLRKRIKSVTNTQQITKAMKMVASARLRRANKSGSYSSLRRKDRANLASYLH